MQRRFFWPLIALGSVCLALASASYATAVFSDPIPREWTAYAPLDAGDDNLGVSEPEIRHVYWGAEAFDRFTSLSWSLDRGFLVATILFGAAALASFVVASRLR